MSDIEKYVALADWVSTYVRYYNDGTGDVHNAYSALHDHYAVCEGYAELYNILCHAAGLPCDIIWTEPLSSKIVGHAFNYIPNVNGHDYFIDTCWNILFATMDSEMCIITEDGQEYSITYSDRVMTKYAESSGIDINCTYKDFCISDYSPVTVSGKRIVPLYYSPKHWFPDAGEIKFYDNPIDPYIELGSGIRGQRYAKYEDYALLNPKNTGIWYIDDYWDDPKWFVETANNKDIAAAIITGSKGYYDYSTIDDIFTALSQDLNITLGVPELVGDTINYGQKLNYGTDYEFIWEGTTADKPDENGDIYAYLEVRGKGEYQGSNSITIKINSMVLSDKPKYTFNITQETAGIYPYLTLLESDADKSNARGLFNGSVNITSTNSAVANMDSYGRVYIFKPGNTTITVTSDKKICIFNITVPEKSNPSEPVNPDPINPVNPTVENKTVTLVVGTSILDEDLANIAKTTDITGYSNSIAKLSQKGLIQAKKVGNTNFKINTNDGIISLAVKVIAKPTLKFSKTYTKSGQTDIASDYLKNFDQNIPIVKWTSSKPAVAAIDNDGNITIGNTSGKTTITAYFNEKGKNSATATVKVSATLTVKLPMFAKSTITMKTGQLLTVEMKNIISTYDPVFTTSDDNLVATTVYDKQGKNVGKVSLQSLLAGNYTLTATIDGIDYTCNVKVVAPTISKSSISTKVNKKISISLKNTKIKKSEIVWISEDSDIVDVQPGGQIVAKKRGETVLYTETGGIRNECKIIVK